MLGLIEYYHKFISAYSDLLGPLTQLTCKHFHLYGWNSFRSHLDSVYPDPNKGFSLFANALKFGWSAVLSQEYTTVIYGKEITLHHPIICKWPILRKSIKLSHIDKETYVIYMAV